MPRVGNINVHGASRVSATASTRDGCSWITLEMQTPEEGNVCVSVFLPLAYAEDLADAINAVPASCPAIRLAATAAIEQAERDAPTAGGRAQPLILERAP